MIYRVDRRCRTLAASLATLALLLLLPTAGRAADYTVSPAGDDGNPGTREKPFRTITRAADVMQPGDACTLRAGTYRETVRPKVSGEPGKPIRFLAAPGEEVTLSGADPIPGPWVVHQGAIYKAATGLRFDQLFVDGKMMTEARWPNTPLGDLMRMERAAAGPGTDYEALADPKLPEGDWNGTLVLIWPGSRWTNSTRRVVSYAAGKGFRFDRTLKPEKADPYHAQDPYRPKPGNPYILFGALAGLDMPGEWCLDQVVGSRGGEVVDPDHNPTTPPPHHLYLWTPAGDDPAAHAVEVKQRDLALDLKGLSHVEVRGVRIFAAGVNMDGSSNCLLEDCHLRYAEHFRELDGYKLPAPINVISGRNNEWRRCSIAYSATTALRMAGEGNRLVNCIIRDANYLGTGRGGVLISGTGSVIRQSSLFRAGRDVVQHGGAKKMRVEYCDIHHANMLNNDSGATYAWGTDGDGSVIAYNWVHDNLGDSTNGIYLDNFCKNFIVHHNVVWNSNRNGIRMNSDATNHLICNNTLTRNTQPFGVYTYSGRVPTQKGTRVVNNLVAGRLKVGDPSVFVQGELAPVVERNGSYPMDAHAVPVPDSGAIDAGVEVPGITDGFVGKAPDVGAYEAGGKRWTAGADWRDEGTTPTVLDLAFAPRPPLTEATMITEGLQIWLDAADVEADAGGAVRRWKDRSGKGRDAVPAAPGDAFVLQARALNGRPVVRFGGKARLVLGSFRGELGGVTALIVSRGPAASGAGWQRLLGARAADTLAKEWEQPNWQIVRPGGGTAAAYEAQAFTFKKKAAHTLQGVVLGGSTAAETQYLDGEVAEVLLYDRCLSEDEEDALLTYLSKKWGLKAP